MELFKLFGSILVDSDEANKSISKTDKNAEGLGKKLGDGIKTAAKWGTAIFAGAAVAGGAMLGLGVKVGDMADAILDLNSITGMSTDSIQKWRKATEVAGVAQDAMTNASAKLTKSLDAMSEGSNKGNEALSKLGFSLQDIESMSADERMDILTEALAGVEDKTERARLGTDLFGGSWKEIAPVVDLGTEAMQKAKDSANIISNDDLVKANEFRIKVADMKDQVSFFATKIGISLLPMLTGFFDWIQQYMPEIQAGFKFVFDFIGAAISLAVEWVGKLISWLKQWQSDNSETLARIKDTFMAFFEAVYGFIEGFIQLAMAIWNKYGEDITAVFKAIWDTITTILDVAITIITDIFNIFAKLFKGDWEGLWNGVKKLFSDVWDGIGRILEKAIEYVKSVIKLFGNVLSDIWSGIWNGIKNVLNKLWDDMVGRIKESVNKIREMIQNVLDFFQRAKDKVSDFVSGAKEKVSNFFGGGEEDADVEGLASGGKTLTAGRVLVGEQGPEFLDLPRGAKVTPLDHPSLAQGGITFARGAFEGAVIMDDYGVDRLMDKVVGRMRALGAN